MKTPLHIVDLGLVPYAKALRAQDKAVERVVAGGAPTLFLLEHPPTVTFGRNGGAENLPLSRAVLEGMGVEVAQTRRGGNITCHFPGQMVAYPVLRVDRRPGGLKGFFHDLESAVIAVLAGLGIAAERRPGLPGVWTGRGKICSIGIAVKRWVTSHGLALNVARDLSLFNMMNPCGLPGVAATSVARELDSDGVGVPEMKLLFAREFRRAFGYDVATAITGVEAAETHPSPPPLPAPPVPPLRLPAWLRRPLPAGPEFSRTRGLVEGLGLSTVCKGAKCPNMHECFSAGTATFLILGDTCTRNCAFCNIAPGSPGAPDPTEPERVAEAARALGLSYVVITSVTRDDLPDGGAGHFAATVRAVRAALPESEVEVLIPDFQGAEEALAAVAAAGPAVINHNVETHPDLYPSVRPQADYGQSLTLLRRVAARGVVAKSGFMVGLGETEEQVRELLRDLKGAGCSMITIGQYMRPSKAHPPVARYVTPEEFAAYAAWGREMGIPHVFSAPLVRSSYRAGNSHN